MIRLHVFCDVLDEDLESMVGDLRQELLHLDVEDVSRASAGPPPPGARAAWSGDPAELVVAAGETVSALSAVVKAVRSWRSRASPRPSIKIEFSGDVLEVSDATADQADQMIAHFLALHPPQPGTAQPGTPQPVEADQ